MAQVTVFTAERMQEIEDTTVVSGLVDVNGNLLLRTREGEEIDAGHVKGDKGDQGDKGEDGIEGSAALPAGTISLWASDVAPTNWLICDGSAVSRTEYPSLFEAIGIKYGAGDGVNTFNLPNLKGRTPVGKDSTQTEFNALAKIGGEKAHLLTVAEMPSHTHTQNQHAHTLDSTAQPAFINNPGSTTGAAAGTNWGIKYPNNQAWTESTAATNQNTGGGAAHNILQPYTVVNFIIKLSNGDTPGDSQLTNRVSELEANFSSTPAGTMTLWPSDVAPTNWLICDGAAVSRTTYASLFAAIGIKYGAGDGSTTFNLPNLKGRVPVGRDAAQAEFDVLGETGGNKTHRHYHASPLGLSGGNMYLISPGDVSQDDFGADTSFSYIKSTNTFAGSWAVGNGGALEIHRVSSSTESTLQPYQVVNYIIKFTNGDTKGDSQLTQRVSALESGENNAVWLRQKMAALQRVFTGGGVRKVSAAGVSWTQRFITLGTGNDESTPEGYFNIDMPPNGTVIPIHNNNTKTSVTVANGVIPLTEWGALYYDAPIGAAFPSQPGRFHIVSFQKSDANAHIPPTWILIAARNDDGTSAAFTWGDGRSQDYWRTVSLLNGWVNYGGGHETASYKFSDNGEILIKGLIANGVQNYAFLLPAQFAPFEKAIFNAVAGAGGARIDVDASAGVWVSTYYGGGGNGYVSLAGIHWFPSGA